MLPRLLSLLCLLSIYHSVFAQQSRDTNLESVPETCPATKPYQTSLFVPPPPYAAKAGNGRFWFGSDRLWTNLPVNGTLKGLPVNATSGHPKIVEKMFWWRQGYDAHREPQPKMKVTGKRIDSPGSPLRVSPATNAMNGDRSAILVGVDFPTFGCWQITGRYEDDELTFVLWVTQ
jgi:hypothetical protein